MQKKCTNSKCRKTFIADNAGKRCPFCGKLYPRLALNANNTSQNKTNALRKITKASKNKSRSLYIKDIGERKVDMIKAVRKWTGKGLKESKELVESAPVCIVESDISFCVPGSSIENGEFTVSEGDLIEIMAKELLEAGCHCAIIYEKKSKKARKTEKDLENMSCQLYIKNIGNNKLDVIRVVRKWTNMGLKEVKELVESAPVCIDEKDISSCIPTGNIWGDTFTIPTRKAIEIFAQNLKEIGCDCAVVYV